MDLGRSDQGAYCSSKASPHERVQISRTGASLGYHLALCKFGNEKCRLLYFGKNQRISFAQSLASPPMKDHRNLIITKTKMRNVERSRNLRSESRSISPTKDVHMKLQGW